jgi:hypothetical protein
MMNDPVSTARRRFVDKLWKAARRQRLHAKYHNDNKEPLVSTIQVSGHTPAHRTRLA